MLYTINERFRKIANSFSKEEKQYYLDAFNFYLKENQQMRKKYDPLITINSFHALVDDEIKHHLQKEKPTCTKKCSFCCYQPILITKDEANLISVYCISQKIKTNSEKAKIQSKAKSWSSLSLENKKCIFLKDNLCSIYKHRPLSCRTFFVRSKPKYCDLKRGKHRIEILFFNHVEVIVTAIYYNSKISHLHKAFSIP